MLTSFSVENYRAFATEQRIALKPITLFFGWNSGGKSSLLRFLPLLSESIQAKSRPIWLSGEVGRRASWADLVCKGTENDQLRFSLEWEDENLSKAEWSISGDLSGAWQEIRDFKINNNSKELHLIEFEGLCPSRKELNIYKEIELNLKLRSISREVQWLQGLRRKTDRFTQYGGGTTHLIKSDGSDAADHLIESHGNYDKSVFDEVQNFFRGMNEELSLDNSASGIWRLLLCPKGKPTTRIALCDTGEGYSQVLPVLVALARAKHDGPRLLCLEQPELHLHTRAQAQLALQLVSAATSLTKPRILVETHSEVLLSSIQLAIARKELNADDVQVYWIESSEDGTGRALPVNFNENGQPDNSLLSGAFGEALRIGQQLIEAQLRNIGISSNLTIRPS